MCVNFIAVGLDRMRLQSGWHFHIFCVSVIFAWLDCSCEVHSVITSEVKTMCAGKLRRHLRAINFEQILIMRVFMMIECLQFYQFQILNLLNWIHTVFLYSENRNQLKEQHQCYSLITIISLGETQSKTIAC